MGKEPTKAASNIYCVCRKNAARYNQKLGSREGAAEILGISVSSLADYELGNTIPPVDKVNLMSDLYGATELINYYCSNECPLGRNTIKKLEVKEIDRTALELLYSLTNAPKARDLLLKITADGIISSEEEEDLNEIILVLDNISKGTAELKLSIEKARIR